MATEAQIYAFCLLLFPFSLIPFPFCEAGIFTLVESALQIRPFMQNKPNFQKSQMNVNLYNTTDYENIANWTLGKNEPKTNPIKANTNPIKANIMPKQTQYKPNTKPNKANFRLSLCL